MEDFWRKTWNFGVGVMDFTREKIEALVAEMVRRGEVSQQESSQAVQQILEKAKEQQEAFTAKVKELIRKVVGEMGLAHKSDLEALEKRLADLEEKIRAGQS